MSSVNTALLQPQDKTSFPFGFKVQQTKIKWFHTLVFLLDLAVLIWRMAYGESSYVFGWVFIYLTTWGVCIQTAYFGVAAACDWKPEWRVKLLNHRDRFFTLEAALATFVGIMYYSLIFPQAVTSDLTNAAIILLDTLQHGTTTLFIWIELFLVEHAYRSWKWEMLSIALLSACYLAWNFICHSQSVSPYTGEKFWPYDFQYTLADKNWFVQVLTYGVIGVAFLLLYMIQRALSRWYWGRIAAKVHGAGEDSYSALTSARTPVDDV